MTGFLVLARQHDNASAFSRAVGSLAPMLERGDWRCMWSGDWAVALIRNGGELSSRPILGDQGLIIGDLFARGSGGAPLPMDDDATDFERQCRRLSTEYWGRYVAVRRPTQTSVAAAFRDPSGALDCLTWAAAGVTVLGSELPPGLPYILRPKLSLDWDAVGAMLVDPTRSGGALALNGARSVWPGELWYDDPARASTQIWSPRLFAAPSSLTDDDLKRELVSRVDACVSAWLPPASGALFEVSGGLDSAIVATSAAKVAAPGPRIWLNYYASHPRSDERRFARAVAAVGGFELTEAEVPVAALDFAAWRALSAGMRPPFNALALHRDRDVARRCAAAGLSRAVTGEGGDLVFFQAPTSLVLADLMQSGASPSAVLRATHDVARWTGQSAWRGLFQAVGAGRRRTDWQQARPRWPALSERTLALARPASHPWLEALDDVPPGKRLQIASLAACQTFHGDSHTARTAAVVHPLLCQPVVELCLQIPTFQLTRCQRGRAFAREAFAARLPTAVAGRQAKGELNSHYGRVLAASLDALRPLLLDGALAGHGLLDRVQLEALLTPELLIVSGDSYALSTAALLEIWVSGWLARL